MSCRVERGAPPVLLLNFNRPDFTARQIEALRTVRPEKVFFAVDGPRPDRPGEAERVAEVRRLAGTIDWTSEVKTLFRERNLGCKLGVSGAITWFFDNVEEGVVLEDDCRPTADFFRFAAEALERYRDDTRIGAVCGFNFFNLQRDGAYPYHFSRHMDVWGWASWRRVWKDYDIAAANDADTVAALVESSNATPYYKRFYEAVAREVRNGLSTWDVQFALLFMRKGYLSVVPKERLVANEGLADRRATHTGGYVYWAREWTRCGAYPAQSSPPPPVVCDDASDRLRERIEGAILPRGLTWLGAKAPRLGGVLSAIGGVLEKTAPFLFRL
ncbi:MAG: hypothetical protein IJS46_03080 [Kiritimatiellae bacterium]|nr:hypothetical protein [Kiritimatiellia bacterium]